MIPDRPFLTVLVYQYKKYAPWMLVAYCVMVLGFFIVSTVLNSVGVVIYCSVLFSLPVYAALFPKSIFSVRSFDDRPLTITSTSIDWDGISMPVRMLKGPAVYIFSYENFRHHQEDGKSVMTVIEPGDQNTLEFIYNGAAFDFTFYLPDYDSYNNLMGILALWDKAGYPYSARAAFDREYILSEREFYSS